MKGFGIALIISGVSYFGFVIRDLLLWQFLCASAGMMTALVGAALLFGNSAFSRRDQWLWNLTEASPEPKHEP